MSLLSLFIFGKHPKKISAGSDQHLCFPVPCSLGRSVECERLEREVVCCEVVISVVVIGYILLTIKTNQRYGG